MVECYHMNKDLSTKDKTLVQKCRLCGLEIETYEQWRDDKCPVDPTGLHDIPSIKELIWSLSAENVEQGTLI
jgi:hypothetical protein